MSDVTVPVVITFDIQEIEEDAFLLMLSYAESREAFVQANLTTFMCALDRKSALDLGEALAARAKAPLLNPQTKGPSRDGENG